MKIKKLSLRIIPIIVIAILSLGIFWACGDEDDITPQIKIIDVNIVDVTDSIVNCDLSSFDTVIVINSNAELQTLCNNPPIFDFTDASLLTIAGGTGYGIYSLSSKLEEINNSQYILYIDIVLNDVTAPEIWSRCFLTSKKIPSGEKVFLQVNIER